MENINTPMVNISESNPPINDNGFKTEVNKNNLKRKRDSLVLVLVFIIILLIGLITYLFLTNRVDLSSIDNETNQEKENENSEVEEDSDNETNQEKENENSEVEEDSDEEPVAETQEYYNEVFGVKFDYPKDWVVIEEKEEGDMAFTLRIGENNMASEFIFLFEIKPSEGGKCVYSKSDLTISEGPTYETLYDNYVEIGTTGKYRRSYSKYGTVDAYLICQKDQDGFFKNPLNGSITYWNFDKTSEKADSMLEVLDSITLSYEYTGD